MAYKNMTQRSPIFTAVLSIISVFLFAPHGAAEEAKNLFRVAGFSINSEAEKAEICASFNAPFLMESREAVALRIRLEKNGKKVAISPEEIGVTRTEICVGGLERDSEYVFSVNGIKSATGNLTARASRSFSVPDMKQHLSFEEPPDDEIVSVFYGNKILPQRLESVNVPSISLQLYRIDDAKYAGAAWLQNRQISIAPSESVYFAESSGEKIGLGELALKEIPNKNLKSGVTVPHDGDLPVGLYFLSARPKNAVSPSLSAGIWFVVSSLKIFAAKGEDSISLLAADIKNMRGAEAVKFRVLDAEGQTIGEAESGADGKAEIKFSKEKMEGTAYIAASSQKYGPAIVALEKFETAAFSSPPNDAILLPDKEHYEPGDTANVALLLRGAKGKLAPFPESSLKLLRPDQSFHSERGAPKGKKGLAFVSVPIPYARAAGEWSIMWQGADGKVLARKNIRISSDKIWPNVQMYADRDFLKENGVAEISVKVTDSSGRALAGKTGKIVVSRARPSFSEWDSFAFGAEEKERVGVVATEKFLTSPDGTALVHVKLPQNEDGKQPPAYEFTARIDGFFAKAQCEGCPETIEKSARLNIPSSGRSLWIGVSASEKNGEFSEKDEASFNIIALDGNAKKTAAEDLYYNVYEDGRSFEWYPAEGHWESKPLPLRRRVDGRKFSITTSGSADIKLKLPAGNYMLEITDKNGKTLSQLKFNVSSKRRRDEKPDGGNCVLIEGDSAEQDKNGKYFIRFRQQRPAAAALFVGAENPSHGKLVFAGGGDNVFEIPSSSLKSSGEKIQISAQTFSEQEGLCVTKKTIYVGLRNPTLSINAEVPDKFLSGEKLLLPTRIDGAAKNSETYAVLAITPKTTDSGAAEEIETAQKPVQIDKSGKASLQAEVPDLHGTLKIRMFAWNDGQFAEKVFDIPTRPSLSVSAEKDFSTPFYVGERKIFSFSILSEKTEETFSYRIVMPAHMSSDAALEGKIKINAGERKILSFPATANKEIRDSIAVAVFDKRGTRIEKRFPVKSRLSSPSTVLEKKVVLAPDASFEFAANSRMPRDAVIMPAPAENLATFLSRLMDSKPSSSYDLALAINALDDCKEEILSLGLASENAFRETVSLLSRELQKRQNPDGSFSPSSEPAAGSIKDTAFAIGALEKAAAEEQASVAAEAATRWLTRKMENNWFDEKERGARAAAFYVLASSKAGENRKYISALRYFSNTSEDKKLSAVALAEIGAAFFAYGDDTTAKSWASKALDAAKNSGEEPGIDWLFLKRMSENGAYDKATAVSLAEKLYAEKPPSSTKEVAAYLSAMKSVVRRAGVWPLSVNGNERKTQGSFVIKSDPAGKPTNIKNISKEKLFLFVPEETK